MNNSRDDTALAPEVSVNQTVVRRLSALLPYIAILWLILMTGWYAKTAVSALQHPLNTGQDLDWVRLWIGFAIAVVLSHLLGQLVARRRLVTLIWLGVLTAVALAMIVLSHQVISAVVTAWLLLLSWVWGDWTLRRLHIVSKPLDSVPVAIPLGLALLSLLVLALGMVQLLTTKWAWLIFSTLTLVQARSLVKIGRAFLALLRPRSSSASKESLPEFGLLVVLLGFVFLLDLSWALTPEIHSDAVAAHLPLAQYYVEHNVALVSFSPYVANLVDLLFAVALSLHGQIVAKFLVLASGVVSAVGVYVLGRTLFSARTGLWAAALFYSTPLVSWLSTTAFIDGPVTMFLLSATLAFFQWRKSRENALLWVAGMLTGAAISAKLNALLGLPVIGLVLAWDLARSGHPIAERLKSFARYILGVCLIAGPGFVLRCVFTGNPFYPIPLLSRLFKNSTGAAVPLISNTDRFGVGITPTALLKLPLAFTFETQHFGEAIPAGAIGLALVLAPAALITLATKGPFARRVAILLCISALYVLCLAFIMQYARYYIPVLPVVALLAVQPLVDLPKPKWFRRLSLVSLGTVIIIQVAVTPLMYWNIPERFPLKMAFGLESERSFLERALPVYGAVQFLNAKIEPGRKVLLVGAEEGGRFYLKAPAGSPGDANIGEIGRRSPSTLSSELIKDGFSHLMVDTESWQNQMLGLPYVRKDFLRRFTTLEYSAKHVNIYRLRDAAVEPPAPANLLPNPGFELLSESGYPTGWFPLGQPVIGQSSNQAHRGKMAVRADLQDGLNTRVPVDSDKVYSLGYWCRADKPEQFARLQINWLDSSFQILGLSISVVPAKQQWTPQRATVMSPRGATLAEVYVSVHENSEVWFDDYIFVPGEIPETP